ncbi:MAG: FAD-dependent oxidoreductase [Acidobacteria bacterium]|nr:MAG: FAD-dependent oxidoreductase [Acidobacteriota bacterium]
MDRRTLLKTGSLAALGLGFGGCATTRAARRVAAHSAFRPAVSLPLVDASWDRVIRTTVGLRPHRDSGFVLKAEKLDAKLLIHNYGHGGAGMSLSWGTGYMAADLAMEHGERRAAVVGCGAVGLTAARQLQRRGFEVTIYAMSVPPDTTSNMSLAGFTPTSGLVEGERRTPEWDAQFRRAAEIAYTQLQLLTRPNYGISWIYSYSPTDEIPGQEDPNELLPSQLRTGQVVLEPGEHPFPAKYAIRRSSMRIQPSIYLDALVRDFLLFGGRIVIRKFDTPRDLMSLSESILTHFVPQPEINYQTISAPGNTARGSIGIHMMPRSDGIALGGTSERGVWTLEPNEEARQRIVEAHIHLFTAMRPPSKTDQLTRAETAPEVPGLESFSGLDF